MTGKAVKGQQGFQKQTEESEPLDRAADITGDNNTVDLAILKGDPIIMNDFIGNIKAAGNRRDKIIQDFRAPYYPSQSKYTKNTGTASASDEKKRFSLSDCDIWMNFSIGICVAGTRRLASDACKNGFEFIKGFDKEDAKPTDFPRVMEWIRSTSLIAMAKEAKRYDLGMGIAFVVMHWDVELMKVESVEQVQKGTFGKSNFKRKLTIRKDLIKLKEPPPKTPPDRFEVVNPLYFQPKGDTLTKSKKLNYDTEEWEFSGGVVKTATHIHKDRVLVFNTNEYSGYYRGTSVFDWVKESLLGYYNDLIYIQRGIQNWGDAVQVLRYGNKLFDPTAQKKIMQILRLMEMNARIQIPYEASLDFKPTQIGAGIKDAHEQYKEDISGGWRIPLNQLFGRSEGGGITEGPARISKDDYYERVGEESESMTSPLMKQVFWRFFPKTKTHWLRWYLNTYKTDEQRIKESGLKLDNELKEEDLKLKKLEVKMKGEERTMAIVNGAKANENNQNQTKTNENDGKEPLKPKEVQTTKQDFITPSQFEAYYKKIILIDKNGGAK